MQRNLAAKFSLPIILVLMAAFIAGCQTTKPVDWNSRIGNYTFDQAVTELGPPDKQARLSDGKTVAEWIMHRNGGSGFSVGTGFYGGGVGVGASHSVGQGYSDKVLNLTFDADNKLATWSKNY
jgi:hypothetical protein